MKLIILGSGTCVPSLKRNSPGYYLEAEGCRILVDCGSGTLLQLERAGKSYKEIDAVFITHKHPDHFSDLMPLIQAFLATPQFRREKELLITAPESFPTYYESAIASILGEPEDFPIRLAGTGETDTMNIGPFHVAAGKTVHSSDSLSYRFEHNGKSIVFTGDADYDRKLIDIAGNADVLIADCSFPDSQKAKGHLSSKECGLIARKAGVKKLILSHIYPSPVPDAERVREAAEVFDGEIVLAEDLMNMEI